MSKEYRERVMSALTKLLNEEPDWTATADYLEEILVDGGLLPASATPLNRQYAWAFAENLIENQDLLRENGNLMNLEEFDWDPATAENPEDPVLHLLV